MSDETMSTLREELARQDAAWADAMERLEAFGAAGVPIPAEVCDALEMFEEASDVPELRGAPPPPMSWIRA